MGQLFLIQDTYIFIVEGNDLFLHKFVQYSENGFISGAGVRGQVLPA